MRLESWENSTKTFLVLFSFQSYLQIYLLLQHEKGLLILLFPCPLLFPHPFFP